MYKKWISMLVVAMSACGDSGDSEDALTVGALMPLTGRFGFLTQALTGAMDVARNEVNASGGIAGRPMRIELGDDGSGADEALVAAEVARLKALGIDASLVASSGGALFAVPAATANDMILISGSAASPSLSAEEGDVFFRTIMTGLDIPRASAAYMDSEGIESVAMLTVANDALYGFIGPTQVTASEALGIEVLVDEQYVYESGNFDPTSLLEMVYSSGADALWIGGYGEDGAELLAALDRTRFTGRLFGGTGFQQEQFVEIVGAAKVEGLEVLTTFQPSGPAFERFRTAYQATNGTDVDFYAILQAATYDATAVLALALAAEANGVASSTREGIRQVGGPPGTTIEAGQLAEGFRLLEMGMPIDYQGLGSDVDFDAQGDVATAYGVWRFSGGTLSYVRPLIDGIDY